MGGRIMTVDDSRSFRMLIGHSLRQAGYEVVEAVVASVDFSDQDPVLFAAYGDDVLVREFNVTTVAGDVILLPGENGTLDTGDVDYVALYPGLLAIRPGQWIRSNPLDADTDDDLLSDGAELALGSNPIDPTDAGALLDSDKDGVFDIDESRGLQITINNAPVIVRSNPTRADSDGDGLPDFVEYQVGSNPSSADTDADGLSDYDEFSEAQFAQYASYVELFEGFELDGTSSMNYGTDLNQRDTDGDTLSDKQELDGTALFIPVQTLAVTNPRVKDTDGDGLDDDEELARSQPTNPLLYDTDGDGSSDKVEIDSTISDPLVWDVLVTVTIDSFWLEGTEGTNDYPDWQWTLNLQKSGDSAPGETLESQYTFVKENPSVLNDTNSCTLSNSWCLWGVFGGNGSGSTIETYEQYKVSRTEEIWTLFALQKNDTSRFMRYPNITRTILLKEGDFFTLTGAVNEVDAIINGLPDSTPCNMRFNKTYTTQDFRSFGTVIADEFSLQDGTCEAVITYSISTAR